MVEPLLAEKIILNQRRLRVCHLAYTFYENDNRVLRYAETLNADGHQVDVIALRRAGQSRGGSFRGVNLLRIQLRAVTERRPWMYLVKLVLFLVQATLLLGWRHLRKPYDIVHVHNVPDFLVFSAVVPKLMGARIILDIHDVVPELYVGKFGTGRHSLIFRLMLQVERLSCRFADHVIVANDLWRAKLIRRSVSEARCTTFLNYPDLSLFAARRQAKANGAFTLLYPGSLSRHQGLHVAIDAFALLKDRLPQAELHIYGEGSARDDLAQQIRDRHLDGRVRLLAPLPIDQISTVMASADVGVEPKLADGFANEAVSTKILEFMACGVPVVVSRTDAHLYYFNSNVVRFFRAGDAADLADALVQVHDTPLEQEDRVGRARVFAARLSWQEHAGDYRALVMNLLTTSCEPGLGRYRGPV